MKISVIVPVYNAEKYLEKCILSVIEQTYSDWELILVDDGSVDSSFEIIKKYEEADARIKSINKDNSGPGSARNSGIQLASGDYVVFLDSDDYLSKDYFELLAPKAEKNDLVFIDVVQISTTEKILSKELMSVYKTWDKEKILRAQMTGKIPWGGVRKAVSLELIRKDGILFTEHHVGEEALYSFRVLNAAKSVGFLDEKPVYFYLNHANSQSKLEMSDPWGGVVECIKEYLQSSGTYDKYADTLNAFNIAATVVSLDRIEQMYRNGQKRKIRKERIKRYKELYDCRYKIDHTSMSIKAKVFVPFLKKDIYFPIVICSRLRSVVRK